MKEYKIKTTDKKTVIWKHNKKQNFTCKIIIYGVQKRLMRLMRYLKKKMIIKLIYKQAVGNRTNP